MKHLATHMTFPFVFMMIASSSCTPQTPAVPTVDVIGTISSNLASQMLTQTAAAYSPTPLPVTDTPVPTATESVTTTPEFTATRRPEVVGFSPCYAGPGPSYALISNISDTKKVELIGIGSVPGWYVIKNPYFNSPCWISADYLKIFSDIDLTAFPTITP